MRRSWLLLALTLFLGACGQFQHEVDAKFGDQHFKTAIALIELHKTRFGSYPQTLSELKFTGEWDRLPISSVSYARVGDGYRLDVERGWVGKPELTYPPEFWQGLGLKESNVKRATP